MYLIDRLDNGIRVVMERIPYINSVSIGIIIDCGSKMKTGIITVLPILLNTCYLKAPRKRCKSHSWNHR